MKPGPIIGAAIALFIIVETLVGEEGGVLADIQQNSGQVAAADTQAMPEPTQLAGTDAATGASANPWDITDNSLTSEADDFAEPEADAGADTGALASEDRAKDPLAAPAQAPLHPKVGSPEFPYRPLPKPQLTVAGARIDYPATAER